MKSIPVELVPSLNNFLTSINKAYEIFWKQSGYTYSQPPQIRVYSVGKKYAKLFAFSERQGSYTPEGVYCFLDLTTGDLLKAATYKAPVPGKRGNIKEDDVLTRFTVYGPKYLTGGRHETISDLLTKSTV